MFEEMKMSPDFFHKSSTTLNILFYFFYINIIVEFSTKAAKFSQNFFCIIWMQVENNENKTMI